MGYSRNPLNPRALREQAAFRLSGRGLSDLASLTAAQAQQLLEELEIHQIELELQNGYLNAAREALEKSLNQSSQLYDFSPVSSLSLDASGSISRLNLAAAGLLGGERAHLQGSKLAFFVADADRPRFSALMEQAWVSGDVQGGEILLTRGALLSTWVQIRIAPLPQDPGWQVVLLDMHERRQNEEHLRLTEERWKLALEALGDGVWDWKVQTGEMVFSSSFGQLFGFAENEFGRCMEDWQARIHADDRPRVVADMQAQLSDQAAQMVSEYRVQCKDGSWKWVFSRGAVVHRNAQGKALRVVGTCVDITRRKQMEATLMDAAGFRRAV